MCYNKNNQGHLDKRLSPVKLRCEEKLRNRHFAEWRFRPFMRMVTVNPKIWNVIVIGILSPPLRGETKPPIAVLEPQGFNRTAYILPGKSKNVNPCDRFRALDKPQEPAIIKITKDASTSGCPRFRSWKRENSKPSLGRVAVSPVNADRNSQSKNMESQSDRHRNTPFTEDSGENRPSLFWRPWGSKRTLTILPDQSKNVNSSPFPCA